jgi:hypothetical protein
MSETKPASLTVGQVFLAESRRRLAESRKKIEHCLDQLDDAQVWWRARESLNSIGNLVLHLCGNLRQWIVSGVGGAPDVRNRPGEFSQRVPILKEELLQRFDAVVREADAVLAGTGEDRLREPRRIQGFEETVLSAIFDSLAHLAGHTQEIVCFTRMQLGDTYHFAWTPATAEEGAPLGKEVGTETLAVRDAVFGQAAVAAMRLPGPEGASPPEELAAEGGRPGSPLRDPLLTLEQEFQDQEREGKL